MKKVYLCLVIAVLGLAACGTNEPIKVFEGVWDPVGYEEVDQFFITSDSIKAININTGKTHHQCYYKVLRDSVAELKRSWWEPETAVEVQMYINKEGILFINPFGTEGELAEIYPNYTILRLRKHTN